MIQKTVKYNLSFYLSYEYYLHLFMEGYYNTVIMTWLERLPNNSLTNEAIFFVYIYIKKKIKIVIFYTIQREPSWGRKVKIPD